MGSDPFAESCTAYLFIVVKLKMLKNIARPTEYLRHTKQKAVFPTQQLNVISFDSKSIYQSDLPLTYLAYYQTIG